MLLSHSQLSGKKMGPLGPDLPNFPREATLASFLTSRQAGFHLKAFALACSIPLINHSLPDLVQLCTQMCNLMFLFLFLALVFSIALIKYHSTASFFTVSPSTSNVMSHAGKGFGFFFFTTVSVAPRTEPDT